MSPLLLQMPGLAKVHFSLPAVQILYTWVNESGWGGRRKNQKMTASVKHVRIVLAEQGGSSHSSLFAPTGKRFADFKRRWLWDPCSWHGNQSCSDCGAAWESYTRRSSKQIRWEEAADFQSLGSFQPFTLSAAENPSERMEATTRTHKPLLLHLPPPPPQSQWGERHFCIPDTTAHLGKRKRGINVHILWTLLHKESVKLQQCHLIRTRGDAICNKIMCD